MVQVKRELVRHEQSGNLSLLACLYSGKTVEEWDIISVGRQCVFSVVLDWLLQFVMCLFVLLGLYWWITVTQCSIQYTLQVKTDKGSGSNSSDPYVAFRKRTEKMQTRKNRKNDESSYEKMLKLRRDLSRAVTLLEMVKRREKAKREFLNLNIEVFERR